MTREAWSVLGQRTDGRKIKNNDVIISCPGDLRAIRNEEGLCRRLGMRRVRTDKYRQREVRTLRWKHRWTQTIDTEVWFKRLGRERAVRPLRGERRWGPRSIAAGVVGPRSSVGLPSDAAAGRRVGAASSVERSIESA